MLLSPARLVSCGDAGVAADASGWIVLAGPLDGTVEPVPAFGNWAGPFGNCSGRGRLSTLMVTD